MNRERERNNREEKQRRGKTQIIQVMRCVRDRSGRDLQSTEFDIS